MTVEEGKEKKREDFEKGIGEEMKGGYVVEEESKEKIENTVWMKTFGGVWRKKEYIDRGGRAKGVNTRAVWG